ncbi:carbohydrate kinase family protein [Undibacterium sp. TJN19]|uniref:carbohydrate kinase family protein n=1 Tax=Undibacterium sp. TJN19 TaxID=3413055 RepID=UPI003BF41688
MSDFPQFACAGEALTDMLRTGVDDWKSMVGGSTWNVARNLAKLGLRTGFAGAISEDVFGDALYAASEEAGLDIRLLQRFRKSPLLAIVAETAPPKYFFIGEDSADLYFSPKALPTGWNRDLQWVHFGGISLAREPLATTLISLAMQLKESGVKISYDPNFRNLMDKKYDATLRTMTHLADVIKISDEDLRGLFRHDNADLALAQLREFNPEAIYLYTRGAAGASLHLGDQAWQALPPQIHVIDTIGAGDASIAGLLFSLQVTPEKNWQEHLNFSVASGAAACLTAGAQAPSLTQVSTLYEKIKKI